MKKWINLSWITMALLIVSCNKDKMVTGEDVTVEWGITQEAKAQPFVLPSEGKGAIPFKASHLKAVHWTEVPQGWDVSLNATTDTLWVTAPRYGSVARQEWTMEVKLIGESGNEIKQSFRYYYIASFDNPEGAFVLNEGNMTTENGSLLYITPEGYIVNDAYKLVNGTELGNVCQDMAFYDDKIYIISQNGDENPLGTKFKNDGMLVVLDAKTLKKIDAYKKEDLKNLAWPSHIAVLDDEHVYIRENGVKEGDNGSGKIWRLNTKSRELTVLSNSEGTSKSRFVKKDGKLYTFKNEFFEGRLLFCYLVEIDKATDEVKTFLMSDTAEQIYGLELSQDGWLWTISKEPGNGWVYNLNCLDDKGQLKKVARLSGEPNVGASGASMRIYKNDMYYASGTAIFKVRLDTQEAEMKEAENGMQDEKICDVSYMDKFARELYNGLDINPFTGQMYVNSIKGVGNFYTTNQIWVFDIAKGFQSPLYKFENYTHFPAGTFFVPQKK